MQTPHAKIFDVVSFPGGDGYQEMIDRIADICGDREDPRLALVLGLKEYQDEILIALRDAGVKDARVIFLKPEELTSTRTIPAQTREISDGTGKVELFTCPEKEITTTIELPHSLASVVNANAIVNLYYRGQRDELGKWVTRPKELAVIISAYQNPENRERYLDVVAKLPVEIFFVEGNYDDKQFRRVDQMVERADAPDGQRQLVITEKGQKPKAVRYLWKGLGMERGVLIHCGGRSSEGKSPVSMDLIARVTAGHDWPDGETNTEGPKEAILLNIEDDYQTKILPRLLAAGGIEANLDHITGTRVQEGDTFHDGLVALDRDIQLLCDLARSKKNLALIVIDPITNYLGKLNMNAEDEVRQVLTPLAKLAQELDIVVITIGHFNKSESKDPLQRMMGAAGFVGVARCVYVCRPDPEANNQYSHVIAAARGDLDCSFKYTTKQITKKFTDDGEDVEVIVVEWGGKSDVKAAEAMEDAPSKRDKSATEEAGDALRNFLKGGKRSASQCKEVVKGGSFALDFDHRLTWVRVRKAAGAEQEQKGKEFFWFLRGHAGLFEPPAARSDDAGPSF